jgi:hypothetical protein
MMRGSKRYSNYISVPWIRPTTARLYPPRTSTDDPFFHLAASAFTVEVIFRTIPNEDRIRKLRTQGLSLPEIAEATGSTPAAMRRIVGPLDPKKEAQRRRDLNAIAKRINSEPGTWKQKTAKWKTATGHSDTMFWRNLKPPPVGASRPVGTKGTGSKQPKATDPLTLLAIKSHPNFVPRWKV